MKKAEPVPDISEPILGARAWIPKLNTMAIGAYGHLFRGRGHYVLAPTNMGEDWLPGANVARCKSATAHPHPPAKRCGCGFWALTSWEEIIQRFPNGHVYGMVELWGRVLWAEKGWRAEYALIKGLLAPYAEDTEDETEADLNHEVGLYCEEYDCELYYSLPELSPAWHADQTLAQVKELA